MFIPRMSVMALKFTKVFTKFLLALLIPITLISLIANANAEKQMGIVASFVTTATFIMILGAAIFVMGGGKYVKQALNFGIVLSLFMLTILTPVIIYGLLVKKAFKIVDNFTELVVTSTILMIIGALVFTLGGGAYIKAALKFGAVLGLFMLEILTPILLYSVLVKEGQKTLKSFSWFIVIATTVMLLGAYFMAKKEWVVNALAFGATLMLFTTLILLPIFIFGLFVKDAMKTLKQLTMFILVETAVMLIGAMLVLNNPEYIVAALAFGIMLSVFIGLTLAPFLIFRKKLQEAIPNLLLFGAFIFVVSVTLMLGAIVVDKYWKGAIAFTTLTLGFVYGMYRIVDIIGDEKKTEKIRRGIINGLMLAGLLAVIAISFGIVNLMLPEGKDLAWVALKVGVCMAFILGMQLLVKVLGKIGAADLTKGILAAGGIAIVIALMGFALHIVEKANISWKILGQVSILALIAVEWGLVLGLLGALVELIGPGIAAAAGISVVMALFGWSLTVVHNGLEKVGGLGKALEDAGSLTLIALAYGVMFIALIAAIPGAILGLVAVTLISAALVPLSLTLMLVGEAVKIAEKSGDPKAIKTLIDGFMDAIPTMGIFKYISLVKNVNMIRSICNPLAFTLKRIGATVADLASLKVATEWDKDGNPTKYRQLKESDFKLAAEGVTKIIVTMANGIMQAAAYYEQIDKKTLKKTLFASKSLGDVIGSISTGLQAYAQLMIPLNWNTEGKPTEFRKMTNKDFSDAAENIRKIILLVGGTIAQLATGSSGPITIGGITVNPADFMKSIEELPATGLRGILGMTNPSRFVRLLTASSQLGEMISNIASGIQAFASMNIPIAWNDEGKPIKFKALKKPDIEEAVNNVKTILLTLAGAILDVYNDKRSIVDGKNIFDSEIISTGFLGLSKKETSSRFEKTLAASIRLGELIANIATGLQAMANLRIPYKFNDNGKPIEYMQVNLDELKVKVPSVISDILLTTVSAVLQAADKYKNIMSPEDFREITESFVPIGSLISNVAEALVKYTELKIPIYDAKGNIIGYKEIPEDIGTRVAVNIGTILCALSTALFNAYKSMDVNPEVLDSILNSFTLVGKIVKDTAEAIVNFASGRMIDPKTGKETMIGPAVMSSASQNIQDIIICIVKSIADAYDSYSKYFKSQDESDSLYAISNQLIKAGELVKSTVALIVEFAKIKPNDITAASENIKSSVSTIPQAILDGLNKYDHEKGTIVIEAGTAFLSTVNAFLTSMLTGIIHTIIENRKQLTTIINFNKLNKADNGLPGVFSDIRFIIDNILLAVTASDNNTFDNIFNTENLYDALGSFLGILDYIEIVVPKLVSIAEIMGSSVVLSDEFFKSLRKIIFDVTDTIVAIGVANKSRGLENRTIVAALNDFYNKSAMIELFVAKIEMLQRNIKGFNFDSTPLISVQSAATSIAKVFNSIKQTTSDPIGGALGFTLKDLKSVEKKVNSFSKIVREMIKASSMMIADTEIFNKIGEGISTINNKVSSINDQKIRNINNEVKSLEKFVKVVDDIDISKASKLTSLVDSMANLADKMGGFDQLVKLLDGDLKEVLSELSEKIADAKETIKRAERIETERQKKLADNIKNIKNLMKDPVTINVGKLEEDNSIKAGYEKQK